MSSHFSAIGFEVKTNEDVRLLVERGFREGKSFPSRNGRYVQWQAGSGTELWLALDHDDSLITMHPHFAGEGIMAVGITRRIIRDSESPLVGGFHAFADTKDGDIETGAYPFVFDVPNLDSYVDTQLPLFKRVQLAAFADELTTFKSDEQFLSEKEAIRLAPESFIPTGLFSISGDGAEAPPATAIFSGHVLSHSLVANRTSGASFSGMRVQTLGGVVDVVADPADVQGSPNVGGVIRGSFWLSGRILE